MVHCEVRGRSRTSNVLQLLTFVLQNSDMIEVSDL